MPLTKKMLSGKRVSWGFQFAIGGRGNRQRFKQGGFATRSEALTAESKCRLEIDRAQKVGATGTLGGAIAKFFEDRSAELSPKTLSRYRELAEYLSPELKTAPIAEIRAMHLHDEWKRLLASGGHHRKTKELRPLSAKTVRNIAGVVSSACGWAVLYGLITVNPVTASKPPQGKRREGIALLPSQVDLMIQASSGWLMNFLDVENGLGIRRGEALALRWSDIANGEAHITRSLCQVKDKVTFKGTKSDKDRRVEIAASTMDALRQQREEQDKARAAFPDYRFDLDLIFADPGGEPLRPDSVSSKVSLLCRKLKLPKGASLHTLRHSHGSQLLAAGVPLAEVAKRLGHANPATTLGIYTHALPGTTGTARRWEELQGKEGGKPQ